MSVISHQLVGNQGNTYAITKNHKKRYPSLKSGELLEWILKMVKN